MTPQQRLAQLQQMVMLGKLTPQQAQQMSSQFAEEQRQPVGPLVPPPQPVGPPSWRANPAEGSPTFMGAPRPQGIGAYSMGPKKPPLPTSPFAQPAGPSPGAVRTAPGQAPYQPAVGGTPAQGPASPWMTPTSQQGMTPDARAMIDAMTGKRVHKGMGGQQLGLQGVSPTLKYLLYSMKGRRHLGMGGQELGPGADKADRNSSYVEAVRDLDKRLEGSGLGSDRRLLVVEAQAVHNEEAWANRLGRALAFLFPASADGSR